MKMAISSLRGMRKSVRSSTSALPASALRLGAGLWPRKARISTTRLIAQPMPPTAES